MDLSKLVILLALGIGVALREILRFRDEKGGTSASRHDDMMRCMREEVLPTLQKIGRDVAVLLDRSRRDG